ncbi:MAG: DUF1499 domain-containing protein [Desulfosoma sp.]
MTQNPIRDCGSSPNCVSSTASDPARRIDPMPVTVPPARLMAELEKILTAMPRTTIVERRSDFLRAEVRSLLGFVDDVEFFVDPSHNLLHMRSASRTGYWDLGVNRRRLETVRSQLRRRLG